MSVWRSDWQSFKKQYPQFEKSKAFKSDIGPQMDQLSKIDDEIIKLCDAIETRTNKVKPMIKSVDAALKGYEQIVKDLAIKDKKILKDFNQLVADAKYSNINILKRIKESFKNVDSV